MVAEYDTVVRSPSRELRLPSVVAMRSYVPMTNRVAFTRFNVFLRDRFRCQYCGEKFPSSQLTFERFDSGRPSHASGETRSLCRP